MPFNPNNEEIQNLLGVKFFNADATFKVLDIIGDIVFVENEKDSEIYFSRIEIVHDHDLMPFPILVFGKNKFAVLASVLS
ncbi:MAG: hypothetical protein NZZ41_04610 [Candidatus Dojkabacteria bacterium]|nr:hypothetical protein [Candidatus Dojkabacteria bacterium]